MTESNASTPDPIGTARREFEASGAERSAQAPPGEHAGDQIGRYKLLQQIGEGGMGTVWMAEQKEPVRRQVALKIIKLGMDTKEVVARFAAERQALALMDHPYIARVLDGGVTDSGRPFFVMDLVRGTPITEYCDSTKAGLSERLSLFVKTCEAIQHAHQKGIIHRDVKPSNVLVTEHEGVAHPKVIDFGIAKATSAELTQKTLFTQHAQVIGTPEYMAPEQAGTSGIDIDTRVDVYSLGVLLYELLTGTKPFDVKAALEVGYEELMRTIREVDPAKPSTRVSTLGETGAPIADNRHVNVESLSKRLRGDLDWIVMKALDKNRERRYETADGFARDIHRYLQREPVLAAPPSASYRLRRLLRRRWRTVLGAATILLLLGAGSTGTTIGWVKARQANQQLLVAVHEKEEALANEREQRGRAEENELRASQAEGLARANEAAARENEQAAVSRQEIAVRHGNLALTSLQFVVTDVVKELELMPETLELRKSLLLGLIEQFDELEIEFTTDAEAGQAIPTLMRMKFELAESLHEIGDTDTALGVMNELCETGAQRLDLKERSAATRHNFASILQKTAALQYEVDGDADRSMRMRVQALELLPGGVEALIDDEGAVLCEHPGQHRGGIQQDIGKAHLDAGRLQESRRYFALGLESIGASLARIRAQPGFAELSAGAQDQQTYVAQMNHDACQFALAYVQLRLGETEEAFTQYATAIESRREIAERYPLDRFPQMVALHQKLAAYLALAGKSMLWLDRTSEAEPLLSESLALSLDAFEVTDDAASVRQLALAHYLMGTLRDVQGDQERAQLQFQECLRLRQGLADRDGSEKNRTQLMLALARGGAIQAARQIADELGEASNSNASRHLDRARCYSQLTRHADSDASREEYAGLALDALQRAQEEGYEDPFRVKALNDLDPLHDRPRFALIVALLEAEAAAKRTPEGR